MSKLILFYIKGTPYTIAETLNTSIDVEAFVDDEGIPTCAMNFGQCGAKRQVCKFVGASKFGLNHHCMLHGSKRIFHDNRGLLVPLEECLVWKTIRIEER